MSAQLKRQSCDRCHSQKLRCSRSANSHRGDTCIRCQRLGVECVYSAPLPKGRRYIHNISSSSGPITTALLDEALVSAESTAMREESASWFLTPSAGSLPRDGDATAMPPVVPTWEWDPWPLHAGNVPGDLRYSPDNPLSGPTTSDSRTTANLSIALATPTEEEPRYPKLRPSPAERTNSEICAGRLSDLIARLWPVDRICQQLDSAQKERDGPFITNAAYESAQALLAPPQPQEDSGSPTPPPACNAFYSAFSASHALHEISHRLLLGGSAQRNPPNSSALVHHLLLACYLLLLGIYRALLQALHNDATAEQRRGPGGLRPVPSLLKIRMVLVLQLSEYFLDQLRHTVQSVLRGHDLAGDTQDSIPALASIAELDAETIEQVQQLRATLS